MSKRNSPCSCGSGAKFKKCCGKPQLVPPSEVLSVKGKPTEEQKKAARKFLASLVAFGGIEVRGV